LHPFCNRACLNSRPKHQTGRSLPALNQQRIDSIGLPLPRVGRGVRIEPHGHGGV